MKHVQPIRIQDFLHSYNKKKCYVDERGLFQKVVSYKLSHNVEF